MNIITRKDRADGKKTFSISLLGLRVLIANGGEWMSS